jgi:hypothetical protein
MIKQYLAVTVAGLGLLLAAAGSASADTPSPDLGTVTFTTPAGDGGTGLLSFTAPMVDGRCALPWFGTVVEGASTPIGSTSVDCVDITTPIAQNPSGTSMLL